MRASTLCGLFLLGMLGVFGQDRIPLADGISLEKLENGKLHHLWLKLGDDNFGDAIKVPVIIAKGESDRKVMGLTAAIHGNELNGIAIIHRLFETLDIESLRGTIVAIPGLNPFGIANEQREYVDGVDLNRIFPGKANGNRSEQIVLQIAQKVIPLLDYHIDLHTASFGRVNTLYGRGDIQNDTLAKMLRLLQPDIIVSNKGTPSFGSSDGLTMRAYAIQNGVHSVTMEYGNPQVFQEEMVERGYRGISNLLVFLGFLPGEVPMPEMPAICSKSYWLYTDKGGYLDVLVDLNQHLAKGEEIAVLRNAFGEIIKRFTAPDNGIVIGKSTNPVNISGGRIIHFGVLAKQ